MGAKAVNAFASYGEKRKRERMDKVGLDMYGSGFADSQGAATMRQAGIQQLQNSLMGLQRALSREAAFMHR